MANAIIPSWAEAAWLNFADKTGLAPFRRSTLTEHLLERMRPRNRGVADDVAARIIAREARAGTIGRHGHLHWVRRSLTRRLKSGREIFRHDVERTLKVTTVVPEKYVLVDLETGDVWCGSTNSWNRASGIARAEAAAILEKR